jgi:hypothetical protein
MRIGFSEPNLNVSLSPKFVTQLLEELQNYFNSRADYLRHHFNYIVDKEPQ